MVRFILIASAVPFFGIGSAFLIAPETMGGYVGLTLDGVLADNDVRAVYGGQQLAAAALLVVCALRSGWEHFGVVALLILFGGLALARLVSWALVGLPPTLGFVLHAGEVVGLGFGLWAWRLVRAGRGTIEG